MHIQSQVVVTVMQQGAPCFDILWLSLIHEWLQCSNEDVTTIILYSVSSAKRHHCNNVSVNWGGIAQSQVLKLGHITLINHTAFAFFCWKLAMNTQPKYSVFFWKMHVSELLAYWMCKKNLYLLKRKETHFVVQNAFFNHFCSLFAWCSVCIHH